MQQITALLLLLTIATAEAEEQQYDKLHISGLFELQLSHTNGLTSWLDRGFGKQLHGGTDNNRLQTGVSGIELDYQLQPNSSLKTSVLYNNQPGQRVDVTELYWHHRPIAKSSWQSEYKAGFFYPSLSLENRSRLWSSPYSITPSTINTWIGEELRTAGIEGRWTNRGRHRQSPHDFGFTLAAFGFNDNTGSLLSWRGWTNSERQTGLGGRLPLADRPNFAQGQLLADQTPEVEPFIERDNRIGFYVGAHWSFLKQTKASMHYYDNMADPSNLKRGQYAWHTRFSHLAIQHQLSQHWEVLGQYMRGTTQMNNLDNLVIVYNRINSGYLMLAGHNGPHRLSLRWEKFGVDDLDQTIADSNSERGSSWTLSYSKRLKSNWKLTIEGIKIRSDRQDRQYTQLPQQLDETRLIFSTRYYWG